MGTVYIDAKPLSSGSGPSRRASTRSWTILNHAEEPVSLTVRVDAGCDFADLFEVKDALRKKVATRRRSSAASSRSATSAGRSYGRPRSRPANGQASTRRVDVHGEGAGARRVEHRHRRCHRARRGRAGAARAAGSKARSGADASKLRLDRRRAPCRVRLGRAEGDVSPESRGPCGAAILLPIAGGRALPAAGLPWFMTMFGRDSIFTSLQALPSRPSSPRRHCGPSATGRAYGSTTSVTRIPAGSSTRCATAR